MTATRGFLATIKPCESAPTSQGNRKHCEKRAVTSDECENCQGNGTRLVVHPDTPAISVEAAVGIVRGNGFVWEGPEDTQAEWVNAALDSAITAIEAVEPEALDDSPMSSAMFRNRMRANADRRRYLTEGEA